MMLPRTILCSLAILFACTPVEAADVLTYDRYPSYPPYCSAPDEMAKRSIPPLRHANDTTGGNIPKTKLVHVTAVIRHGARTPWSDEMVCWEGYWQDPETGIWDCELTTMTSPPSHPFIQEVESNPDQVSDELGAEVGDAAMFLFEKRYDALRDPPFLANAMNGTCQMGQLLLRGYEQEMANGRFLRHAYVYDGESDHGDNLASSDERMRLFDLTDAAAYKDRKPYEEPHLYYRADDEQRTLMSGQVLLRGLWGDRIVKDAAETGDDPVIVLHTADYKVDVLHPNWVDCPRLNDLYKDAKDSDHFQAFNTSKEAETLRRLMVDELGQDFMDSGIDCLMTTMCTDRKLPDILADYGAASDEDTSSATSGSGKYGSNIFQRILDFATYRSTYYLRHNDGAYAKLGMGPLWHEIMAIIRPIVDGSNPGISDAPPQSAPPKMALFSGHDSTIQPLLASLGNAVWDGKFWAPYASMLIIEIHEVITPNSASTPKHMFRLLYNGESITPRMDGCDDDGDLCDASVLVDWVTPFAKIERECASSLPDDEVEDVLMATEALLSAPNGIALVVSMMLTSAFVGGITTFVFLTRRLPFCCRSQGRRRRNDPRESYTGISLPGRTGTAFTLGDDDEVENDVQMREKRSVTDYGAADSPPRNGNADLI